MKKEDLFAAFGNIDDNLIENAEMSNKNNSVKFTNNKFISYIVIAASIAIIFVSSNNFFNTTLTPEDDINYSTPSLNNSLVGKIDKLENIDGQIIAYVSPNIEESLSEYNKFISIPLNEDEEFLVEDKVIIYFDEVSNIDEFIYFNSSIIESF